MVDVIVVSGVVLILIGGAVFFDIKTRRDNNKIDKAEVAVAVSESNDEDRTTTIEDITKHQEDIKVEVEKTKRIVAENNANHEKKKDTLKKRRAELKRKREDLRNESV